MNDVMVDLETVGKRAGCGIISIGAVAFDRVTGELGKEFYQVIRLSSCKRIGLHEDPSTMDWWSKQSDEAKKTLLESRGTKNNKQIHVALQEFNIFLMNFGKDVKVWGNGPDFDNAILYAAYAATEVAPGWEFWNSRCFRTIKDLAPHIRMERGGTHHNALDDAKTQAVHANKVFKYLRNGS